MWQGNPFCTTQRGSEFTKISNNWSLKKTETSYKEQFIYTENQEKNEWDKVKK